MNQVDRLFKEHLGNYEVNPSGLAGENIAAVIDFRARRKKYYQFGIAASISLGLLMVAWLMFLKPATAPMIANRSVATADPEIANQTKVMPPSSNQIIDHPSAIEVVEAIEIGETDRISIVNLNRRAGTVVSQLEPVSIEIARHPIASAANTSVPEESNPRVTIIYKRGNSEKQTTPSSQSMASNTRLQKWISKAKNWTENEFTLPNVGDVANSLFARDSEKTESKPE